MKKIALASALALSFGMAKAQYFQSTYGSSDQEFLTDGDKVIFNTSYPGHVMAGSFSNGGGSSVYLVYVDVNGTTASGPPYFNNEYAINNAGVPVNAIATSVVEEKTGKGFALCGDVDGNITDVLFMRVDNAGNPVVVAGYDMGYERTFAIRESNNLNSSTGLYDYYITGTQHNGTDDIIVLKVDANGAILWDNVIDLNGGTTHDVGYDVIESPYGNGDVWVVGMTADVSATSPPAGFTVQLNAGTGAVVSASNYSDPNNTIHFYSINLANNPVPGFIIGGLYNDPSLSSLNDFLTINVDQNGTINWNTVHDCTSISGLNNECYDVKERLNTMSQYEYFATGTVHTNAPFGGDDVMVLHLDNNGIGIVPAGVCEYIYGGSDDEYSKAISVEDNVAGLTLGIYGGSTSFAPFSAANDMNFYLVKPYMNGYTACNFHVNDVADGNCSMSASGASYAETPGFGTYGLGYSITNLSERIICSSVTVTGGSNAKQAGVQGTLRDKTQRKGDFVVLSNPMQSGGTAVDLLMNSESPVLASVRIVDALGRECYKGSQLLQQGGNQLHIQSAKGFTTGLYYITVQTGAHASNKVLLVK